MEIQEEENFRNPIHYQKKDFGPLTHTPEQQQAIEQNLERLQSETLWNISALWRNRKGAEIRKFILMSSVGWSVRENRQLC